VFLPQSERPSFAPIQHKWLSLLVCENCYLI
jgi:hypothetical protein